MNSNYQPHRNPRRALLVVLVTFAACVLALLTPSFVRCRCQSRLAACKNNLKNIATAIEMYSSDHGAYPRSLTPLVPNYLLTLPKCPSGREYRAQALQPKSYRISCAGGWHGEGPLPGDHSADSHPQVKTSPGFPAVTSEQGLLKDQVLFVQDNPELPNKAYQAALKNLLASSASVVVLCYLFYQTRRNRRLPKVLL